MKKEQNKTKTREAKQVFWSGKLARLKKKEQDGVNLFLETVLAKAVEITFDESVPDNKVDWEIGLLGAYLYIKHRTITSRLNYHFPYSWERSEYVYD